MNCNTHKSEAQLNTKENTFLKHVQYFQKFFFGTDIMPNRIKIIIPKSCCRISYKIEMFSLGPRTYYRVSTLSKLHLAVTEIFMQSLKSILKFRNVQNSNKSHPFRKYGPILVLVDVKNINLRFGHQLQESDFLQPRQVLSLNKISY